MITESNFPIEQTSREPQINLNEGLMEYCNIFLETYLKLKPKD